MPPTWNRGCHCHILFTSLYQDRTNYQKLWHRHFRMANHALTSARKDKRSCALLQAWGFARPKTLTACKAPKPSEARQVGSHRVSRTARRVSEDCRPEPRAMAVYGSDCETFLSPRPCRTGGKPQSITLEYPACHTVQRLMTGHKVGFVFLSSLQQCSSHKAELFHRGV